MFFFLLLFLSLLTAGFVYTVRVRVVRKGKRKTRKRREERKVGGGGGGGGMGWFGEAVAVGGCCCDMIAFGCHGGCCSRHQPSPSSSPVGGVGAS